MLEISDVVVQVVDARDPLFFFSQDLANYVQEISDDKVNVMLVNKSDYLTPKQRQQWAKHFQESDLKAIFFSALESEKNGGETADENLDLEFNSEFVFTKIRLLRS